MVKETTNTYESLRVSCIKNIACVLHVLGTLAAILRQVHDKAYITEVFELVHKCKVLSFKNMV